MKRTSRSVTLGIALLAILSGACERSHAGSGGGSAPKGTTATPAPPATSAPSATAAAIAATDTAALRGALAPFLQPIDTLVTLGAWLGAHPRAAIDSVTPPGARREYVCRFASDTFAIAGLRAVRTALFNRPQPPAGEALPADTTQLANRVCHLRGVWLVTEGADTPTNDTVVALLHRMIVPSLGASHSGIAIDGHGAGTWIEPRAWGGGASGDGTTLAFVPIVIYGRLEGLTPEDSARAANAPKLPNVVLVRVAPHSGYDSWKRRADDIYDDHVGDAEKDMERARVDTALTLARWPRLSAEARILLAPAKPDSDGETHTPARDSALVRLTIAMRDSATKLEPVRRAAAYYVADAAMTANAGMLDNADTVSRDFHLRRRLERLGIEFQDSPLGVVYIYPRTWLWDAWKTDSLGPAGHLAFLTLLANGWGTAAACADSGQGYDRVRVQGEAALRRGETSPLVHYYMGQAEHDIVALSQGAVPSEYANPPEYAPLAPAARSRAIAHLRAALTGLRDTRLRRDAWRMAMTLLLGHSGSTRYFCVYD